MDLWFVHPDGIDPTTVARSRTLLQRTDGFVWVDMLAHDEHADGVLTDVLGAHPLVVADCRQRNHVPTVHGYADHVFVVLHSPFAATPGTCTCSSWTSSLAVATSSRCTGRSIRPWTPAEALRETEPCDTASSAAPSGPPRRPTLARHRLGDRPVASAA